MVASDQRTFSIAAETAGVCRSEAQPKNLTPDAEDSDSSPSVQKDKRELAHRSRRDALPEHTQYLDTGCDIHPSCLTCPLVRCRYDEPGGARKILSEERDRQIVGLSRSRVVTVDAIAHRFQVSRRTVFRVLARSRAGLKST